MTGTIRILVAHRDEDQCKRLQSILSANPDFDIRHATSPDTVKAQVSSFHPHIAMIDLFFDGYNCSPTVTSIIQSSRQARSPVVIIGLTDKAFPYMDRKAPLSTLVGIVELSAPADFIRNLVAAAYTFLNTPRAPKGIEDTFNAPGEAETNPSGNLTFSDPGLDEILTRQSEKKEAEVEFRLYSPEKVVRKNRGYIVVYAYRDDFRQQVEQDADRFKRELGDNLLKPKTTKQKYHIEPETLITVIPESEEVDFEPKEVTKTWYDDWSRFDFEFRTNSELENETIYVRASIQVAGIEIAHLKCSVEVVSFAGAKPEPSQASTGNPLALGRMNSQAATPYQRIFISYSRKDTGIVRSFKIAQVALGNEVFLDVDNLRAGENWQAGLARAIDEADVFQLFWSEHSANSEYCQYEWEYALEYRCPQNQCEAFVRPVYWKHPMPTLPKSLSHLNFKYVSFSSIVEMDEAEDKVTESQLQVASPTAESASTIANAAPTKPSSLTPMPSPFAWTAPPCDSRAGAHATPFIVWGAYGNTCICQYRAPPDSRSGQRDDCHRRFCRTPVPRYSTPRLRNGITCSPR